VPPTFLEKLPHGFGPLTAKQVFDDIMGPNGGTYGKVVFGTPDNSSANAQTKAAATSLSIRGLCSGQIAFTYNTITINTRTDLGGDSWNSGTSQDTRCNIVA